MAVGLGVYMYIFITIVAVGTQGNEWAGAFGLYTHKNGNHCSNYKLASTRVSRGDVVFTAKLAILCRSAQPFERRIVVSKIRA